MGESRPAPPIIRLQPAYKMGDISAALSLATAKQTTNRQRADYKKRPPRTKTPPTNSKQPSNKNRHFTVFLSLAGRWPTSLRPRWPPTGHRGMVSPRGEGETRYFKIRCCQAAVQRPSSSYPPQELTFLPCILYKVFAANGKVHGLASKEFFP